MSRSDALIGLATPRRKAITAFDHIADQIQARDDVDRVRALQKAIDENPKLYESYRRAIDFRHRV